MKNVEAQRQLVAQANAKCQDWPVGECRGLHPSMHKSHHEIWNAAVMLGLLTKSDTVDRGGYTRYTRTALATT